MKTDRMQVCDFHHVRQIVARHFDIAASVVDAWCYTDVIRLWLTKPLTEIEVQQLGISPDRLYQDGDEPEDGDRFKFLDPKWTARIRIAQPTEVELAALFAMRPDHLVNFREVVLELIFDGPRAKWAAREHFDVHAVQLRKGDVSSWACSTTSYGGPRWARNSTCTYDDRPSKFTGQLHALRHQWRMQGAAAVRAKAADTADFDHVDFWRRNLRFRLLDLEKLGRLSRLSPGRRTRGKMRPPNRRRKPRIAEWAPGLFMNLDVRAGSLIARAAMQSHPEKIWRPGFPDDDTGEQPLRPFGAVELVRRYLKDWPSRMFNRALVKLEERPFIAALERSAKAAGHFDLINNNAQEHHEPAEQQRFSRF